MNTESQSRKVFPVNNFARDDIPGHYAQLEVLSYFHDDPENDVSLPQALSILNLEYANWRKVGPENYSPSKLTSSILKSHRRRSAKVFMASLVAFIICFYRRGGKHVSINAAAKIASNFANKQDKLTFNYFMGGTSEIGLVGDVNTIARYFQEYRSVAHILAAKMVSLDQLDERQPFQATIEADLCFLSTVFECQNHFTANPQARKWEMWQVKPLAPHSMADYPPLQPSNDLQVFLFPAD